MRKLSEVLVKSGMEIYRDIIPVALYSVGSSVLLVPILMFAPIPVAVLLLAIIYMPLCSVFVTQCIIGWSGRSGGMGFVICGKAR